MMGKAVEIGDARVLARKIVFGGGVRNLALADRTGNRLVISDFDRETANTVFADGVVLALKRSAFSPAGTMPDFLKTLETLQDINLKELYRTLESNKIAASEGEAADNVILVSIGE